MKDALPNALANLNEQQRRAATTIEGPVMVLAGPGTGKTQLLSVRVANILAKADVEPRNILCLTFTDNASRNMRERLETIIGRQAYHVNIHTFHSFGAEIINQHSDAFADRQLIQQVDELGRHELLRELFDALPHGNPLSTKVGDDFVMLGDTLRIIGWLKQSALSPHELHALIAHNQKQIDLLAPKIAKVFDVTPSPKHMEDYVSLLRSARDIQSNALMFGFSDYATAIANELETAINATPSTGRYAKPLTSWRNRWCEKNAKGVHVLKDDGRNYRKMHAVAEVYERLNNAMCSQGLYDFDDMIMETVHALEQQDDLRLTLQEKYQYILVDEFQDTNKAQLRMLQALGDNPVYEGKPNIMVVGDDDQAIYAFQGADASNMVAFAKLYNPIHISLKENYRSTPEIIHASYTIADQISDRLSATLELEKTLLPQRESDNTSTTHIAFNSELAQYQWLAEDIKARIANGTPPQNIAVIAPRHKYLERLMPYIGNQQIPVAYERRENVLDAPIIIKLITMARLLVSLHANDIASTDALLSEVLSYEEWGIPNEDLVNTSIAIYKSHGSWLDYCTSHEHDAISDITNWLVSLSRKISSEPLEYVLDELLGTVQPNAPRKGFISPLRETLFNPERLDEAPDEYLSLLGQLASLRQSLRQWKPQQLLLAEDLVVFADLHNRARLKIVDSNPHTQTTDAVQVMTAYKAKGLEFDYVYVINSQDEVWGSTMRSQSSRIRLPTNLPIAPPGDTDNDKLRLLFVALTRAKQRVTLTSYTHTLDNKLSPPLSYLLNDSNEVVHPGFAAKNSTKPTSVESVLILSTDWTYQYRQIIADKPTLIDPILRDYKLSVTHLNNFLDITKGGPTYFFTKNLLRFPEAPTPAAAYGDAVHRTLQWAHTELRSRATLPSDKELRSVFVDLLQRKHLKPSDYKRMKNRGETAIVRYLEEQPEVLDVNDFVERGFNNEGVTVGDARLSGKIDRLRITGNQAIVSDFKTGKPATSWKTGDAFEKVKLHRYRQQLLFYKLLVEASSSFQGKVSVHQGELLFVEPTEQGELAEPLTTTFDADEIRDFTELIIAVWRHIMNLDFPDTNHYSQNMKGILDFEKDIRTGKI